MIIFIFIYKYAIIPNAPAILNIQKFMRILFIYTVKVGYFE